MSKRHMVALGSALAALHHVAPLSAEEQTSSLSWVRLAGAEPCISAAALAEAVEKRLGRRVFVSASDADLNIEGSIGPRAEGGYRAVLRVTDRDGQALGTREIESQAAECSAIDEPLALAVSVLIDPDPPPLQPVPPPPLPKREEKIVVEKRIIEREVVEKKKKAPPEEEPIRWELSAAFMSTLGLQPVVGLGVAPAFVLELPRLFALLVEGGFAAKSRAEGDQGAAEAMFMHGALAICPLIAHPDRFSILGCAGWLTGALISNGDGFDVDHDAVSVITGPWLEGRFAVRIVGPVGLVASIGMMVPVTRAELVFATPAGDERLHRTFYVAGLADIGVNVRLP